MNAKNSSVSNPATGDREIVNSRMINAPRELIFEAFRNPDHAQQWWGPKDFRNTFHKFDFREGGEWKFVMHGPTGGDYQNESRFIEIVEPERIVIRHLSAPHFDLTVSLDDVAGKTRLTWHQLFETAEVCNQVKKYAVDANEQNLDRLEERLEIIKAISSSDREIVITRLFHAPRDLVFEAWTDPRHLAHWWGPNGFTITTHSMDFRPNGTWRFVMHGPDGRDYQNRITFREIDRPSRLVYSHGGEEDDEDVRFATTVTFEERGNQTFVTMRALFESAEERNRVAREYRAVDGGIQHLRRLSEYVESRSMELGVAKSIREASALSLAGKIEFPELVGKLIGVGVERYHADYCRDEITYYLPTGQSVVVEAPHPPHEIAEEFSASGVEAAVRQSQRGEHTYADFVRKTKAAGCVGYFVQITGRRAIYFGRSGDNHVEHFPQARD